ncbi:Maf family protein [Silvibacterium dinghuense]|uniref:dTTP/UTP pyrophosphatase n=1 Tax=Silvibacterium dinghuense TaxID=1560006 RepID=A0A4Q1SJT9_9BACT|nr:Maf family protein [Silvibacterium dinghuense]RXS97550.1 septum formation inhibitor Maf [Silvibacterium dinghuense]
MLVLASASPRRKELLTRAGFDFTVMPGDIPEEPREGESPIAYVTRLAREKAEAVRAKLPDADQRMILAADTTVVAPNGEILGKPVDDADAARMLRLLSGATHQVATGVAVLAGEITEVAAEVTWVTFATVSDAEITAYIATGEPRDKAGAYGIQGAASRFIPRVDGCFFNVVGLPVALVASMIEGVKKQLTKSSAVAV